jgi:hypothetical protein
MSSLIMRPGEPRDAATVLALWDKAVRWLVARGQVGQWGSEPVSAGSELVKQAVRDARAAGSELLRADCWAGAPSLVAWYERQGFARTSTFEINDGWRGQLFEMPLADQ